MGSDNIGRIQTECYELRRSGHAVFVTWLRPIEEWPVENDYLKTLREQVRASVEPEVWAILTAEVDGLRTKDPGYIAYVRSLRDDLVEEYDLDPASDDVGLGVYDGDQYVIAFETETPEAFPLFYRGVQLRARLRAGDQ